MTGSEWQAFTDPVPILWILRGRLGDAKVHRRMRLFACACCRRIWHLLQEEGIRELVEASELFADDAIGANEFRRILDRAVSAKVGMNQQRIAERLGWPAALASGAAWASTGEGQEGTGFHAFAEAARDAAQAAKQSRAEDWELEAAAQCALVRDIFGNVFQPVPADTNWRSANVVALAAAIYDERAFGRLPIVADALEDAGCTTPEILDHCRQPGEHVRGCWVVDLVRSVD